MIDLDDRAGGAQAFVLGDFLHGQDWANRNVLRVTDIHDLVLGLGHRPGFDRIEDLVQLVQPFWRRGIALGLFPLGTPNRVADLLPDGRLRDEIRVGVRIGFPTLALQYAPRLATATVVAGPRCCIAERDAFAELAVFLQRPCIQALLIAQLDPAKVQNPVLHRRQNLLATSGLFALEQRGHDPQRQVQAGTAVTDLGTGHHRHAIQIARRRCGSAGALRDVFIDLAVFVLARTKPFDRRHDHARVQFLNAVPAKAHAIQRTGGEVLNQHVAFLDQTLQHFLTGLVLGVQRQRALVVVQHGEIQAVRARHIDQLLARRITDAGAFDLDDIGPEPSQKLGTGRAGLHMCEVQDLDAFKGFHLVNSL